MIEDKNHKKRIKVGSKVLYRGNFGSGDPEVVTVEYIEKNPVKRYKYGDPVDSILFDDREYGVFVLDNGHWCYGDQIDEVNPKCEKGDSGGLNS